MNISFLPSLVLLSHPLLSSHLLPSLSHPLLSSHFRVVQRNLVFVIGLSPRLADPEVLKRQEYFGRFGKIVKVVINNHTVYTGQQVGVSHWPAGGRVTACILFTHVYCASAVGLPYMKATVRIFFYHCILNYFCISLSSEPLYVDFTMYYSVESCLYKQFPYMERYPYIEI